MPPGTMAWHASKSACLAGILALPVWCQDAAPAIPAEKGLALRRMDFSGPGMGTLFRVSLYASNNDRAGVEEVVDAAFLRLAELNAVFSDYEPNSEINRAAAAAPEPWVASPDLLDLTAQALRLAEMTGGAFDPTCGQISRLWRSSRQRGKLSPPTRRQTAFETVGWQSLRLDQQLRTLTLAKPDTLLDFGGIAKGYAADQMLALLRAKGFPIAVVQAGGDTAAGDAPPHSEGWPVQIESGLEKGERITLHLANRSISTSGDLHQHIELDGVRYSHVLDPASGLGLTRRIACSVVADDTTTSDALATAFCVLGPERGRTIARQAGVTARWVWLDADGALHQAWVFAKTAR